MNSLLVVYNTCGISGLENNDNYIESLNSILNQKFKDVKIVVSDCLSGEEDRKKIQNIFADRLSYCYYDEVLPVTVTFNKTILESIKRFGEFDGYVYVDSGIRFINDDQLSELYDLLMSGPYGMVSAQTNDDAGYTENLGTEDLFQDGHFVIPIGKAVNLHVQIFSNDIQKFYGKCYVDIFASYCSESVFSFVCAAINKKWVIHKDVIVNHDRVLHSNSAGFPPLKWVMEGLETYDHPYLVNSVVDIAKKGQKYGLGYEECRKIVLHDSQHYNKEGYCVNTELKEYIKDNLFLSTELLDYDRIPHLWT